MSKDNIIIHMFDIFLDLNFLRREGSMLLEAIASSLEAMKWCEMKACRLMSEAMHFIEVCASNNDTQSDPNEKLLVYWISTLRSWITINIIAYWMPEVVILIVFSKIGYINYDIIIVLNWYMFIFLYFVNCTTHFKEAFASLLALII